MRIWHVFLCLLLAQSVALAGTNDLWQIEMRACNADGYYTQFNSEVGTKTVASDGLDSSDAVVSSVNSQCSWIACYDLGAGPGGNGYRSDYRASITDTAKTWNLKLRVGESWAYTTVHLRLWNPPGTTGITDINGTIPISLTVANDPTGTFQPGHVLMPSWDPDLNGNQNAPAYAFTFSNASALVGGAAVELKLTAGTASESECSIGQARGPLVGQPVLLSGVVASSGDADLSGPWVCSQDLPGLRVSSALGIARGEVVDLSGVVVWTDGVPVLTNPQLRSRQGTAEPKARWMPGGAVGNDRREDLNYSGVNPVGVLCVVCGEVTARDPVAGVFYVDDATGLTDGLGISGDPCRGIRVVCGTGVSLPGLHSIVRVTGIRSVHKHVLTQGAVVNGTLRNAGETLYVPVILIRDSQDILSLSP